MIDKWLSRKLFITLVTDILAIVLAYGGKVTPAQSAAIVATAGTVYLIANAVTAHVSRKG